MRGCCTSNSSTSDKCQYSGSYRTKIAKIAIELHLTDHQLQAYNSPIATGRTKIYGQKRERLFLVFVFIFEKFRCFTSFSWISAKLICPRLSVSSVPALALVDRRQLLILASPLSPSFCAGLPGKRLCPWWRPYLCRLLLILMLAHLCFCWHRAGSNLWLRPAIPNSCIAGWVETKIGEKFDCKNIWK